MKITIKNILIFITIVILLPFMVSCNLIFSSSIQSFSVEDDINSSISNVNSADSDTDHSSIQSEFEPPEPEEEPYSFVNFLACPDNLIHPCIYYDAIERAAKNNGTDPVYNDLHNATYDFSPIYKNVSNLIASADISYLNQESLIGGTSGSVHGYPCFNTPNAMGETVANLGFDIVNVAHNHMLDSGNTNFLQHCNVFFKIHNVNVLGYYPDENSTDDIIIINKNGIRISFLTYTYSTNGIKLDSNSNFVIPMFDEDLIRRQVEIAKSKSDFIIASCHWGNENTHEINWEQKKYAELLTELEVDVVLGMHPHCIQPMEWKTSESGKKTLVVYSLGNFVSGMDRGINNLGCMLTFGIQKHNETGEVTLVEPKVIPFVNHYTKEEEVKSDDKGYRNYEVYLLKDYTEKLASVHGAHSYESKNGTTLEGGAFSRQTLLNTFYKYIPEEFYDPIT